MVSALEPPNPRQEPSSEAEEQLEPWGPGMFGGLGIGGTTPTPTAGTEFGRRAAGALGPTTVGGASGRTCEELFHGRPRLVTMVPQNQK